MILLFMSHLLTTANQLKSAINYMSITPLQASLVAQLVKNLPTMQETLVQFLGWEDPLEKEIGYPLPFSWASLVAQTGS